MGTESILYEDTKIKVEFLPSHPEEHVLTIKGKTRMNFILQRGILRELALTPREYLEPKLHTISQGLNSLPDQRRRIKCIGHRSCNMPSLSKRKRRFL